MRLFYLIKTAENHEPPDMFSVACIWTLICIFSVCFDPLKIGIWLLPYWRKISTVPLSTGKPLLSPRRVHLCYHEEITWEARPVFFVFGHFDCSSTLRDLTCGTTALPACDLQLSFPRPFTLCSRIMNHFSMAMHVTVNVSEHLCFVTRYTPQLVKYYHLAHAMINVMCGRLKLWRLWDFDVGPHLLQRQF